MKPARYEVRQATIRDAAALGQLREDLFLELGRLTTRGTGEFREEAARAFATGLTDGTCEAWMAFSGEGEVIGSVAMLLHARLPSPESSVTREGYLLNVYTAPRWRRRGVADALVSASVARARDLGLGRIRLHATDEGKSVYEKAGFAPRLDEMELTLRRP